MVQIKIERLLASDISKVLAGKSFDPITSIMPPAPNSMEARTPEEVERTLMLWASEDN